MRWLVAAVILLGVLLVGATLAALAWRRADRRAAAEILARAAEKTVDPKGTIRELELAIELDPRCEPRALARIAALRQQAGENRQAWLDASRALALDANNVEALLVRGLAAAELHDAAGAEADFDRALSLDKVNWRALTLRGRMKAGRGDHEGAIDDFTAAIQLCDTSPALYRFRAHEELAVGRREHALTNAEWAARLDDQDPRNWLEVARVRLALGGRDAVLVAADRAALYCPADEAALRSEIATLRAKARD